MAWKIGEFDRIDRFLKPLAAGFEGSLNLTDDAALLAPIAGEEHVVTLDTMVEGTHFLPDTEPEQLAQKLLRVNLSDLAAMGARPVAYFLSLTLPDKCDEHWLHAFTDGLSRDQETFGLHLAGGDTTSTKGPLVISITIIGSVPAGQAFKRSGAKAGDAIMVSGTVGDGYLGLMAAQGGVGTLPDVARDALMKRYNLPNPRVTLARWLREQGIAVHAAVDLSDGLAADLGHICRHSNLRAEIGINRIPLSQSSKMAIEAQFISAVELLGGGDDYELIFTVPEANAEALIAAADRANMPKLSMIGKMVSPDTDQGKSDVCVYVYDADGRELPLSVSGWQHGQ